MRWCSAAIGAVLAAALPAAAEDPPLMCFGNEPSWGLALETPGVARLVLPDEPPAEYRGTSARNEPLRERVWRGRLAGTGPELVAFLRDAECSDGMSDTQHPVVARVSLSDERFLAGCCRMTSPHTASPLASGGGKPPTAIEGSVWRLVRLGGRDEKALDGLAQPPSVRFEAGHLQGFGGCNRLAGAYSIDGDRVTLGPLAGTMMACPQPAMDVEAALKDALAGTLRFRVAEGRLTLASESEAEPRLVFEAAPPPRLEGITWEVTGFNNGRHAVVGPLVGTTLTVSFQDGSLVGHAGCNSFRATYTREGDRLSVGPAAATRMSCDGKGVMEQERSFLAALQSATTWAIDDRGMLDLHRADGERVLIAHEVSK